jgi:hypothetical protein
MSIRHVAVPMGFFFAVSCTPAQGPDAAESTASSSANTGPTATATATSVASALTASSSAGPASSALDPASCASKPGAKPGCHWTIGKTHYCGGAPPPPQVLAGYGKDVCVCNQCAADSDCAARASGKCVLAYPFSCDAQAESRCIYPGDACYGGKCASGTQCQLDGPDKTKCGAPEPPRP